MKELLEFLWLKKKWWLVPPVCLLAIFGILVAVATVSPVGSFIYMLF